MQSDGSKRNLALLAEPTKEKEAAARQNPFSERQSREFFDAVRANDVQKSLQMCVKNPNLTHDCDEDRKTALHWACHNESIAMV